MSRNRLFVKRALKKIAESEPHLGQEEKPVSGLLKRSVAITLLVSGLIAGTSQSISGICFKYMGKNQEALTETARQTFIKN